MWAFPPHWVRQGIGSQVQAWSSKAGAGECQTRARTLKWVQHKAWRDLAWFHSSIGPSSPTASDNLTGMGVSMAALGP
ncbi:hypothetical protein V6N12_048810 [Hibiscus sabdariffa]|uniref:Uncharacterized protein n=1 Tax=Hibiscus sabdariffa TaxID=183260 RepID=A0ABR2EID7_9ROSI